MKKLVLFLSFLFVISCTKDPIIYTLTTSANPADGGTVSPSTQQYDEGKTATITATASSEYLFQSWSGATGSSNSTSVVMNSDKSVTANFVKKKYALTTTVEGEGTVTEKVIKAGAATDYNSGTIVELTAVPSGEWLFVEWKGDVTGTENPTQITIDKAKSVTAVFVKKQYPLTIEIEGEGTVSEKVIKAGAATDYNSGTIVELTAKPSDGWELKEWTGDIASTENPVQITVDEAKNISAIFSEIISFTGTIEGLVQKGPFLSGTKLTIYELNEDLSQTGKSYTSEIVDDLGTFSVSNIQLKSGYVRINADGFYYNEILGRNSESQLSLSLLAKIDSTKKININLITALERRRIEHLMEEGIEFEEAKKQAQSEILKIFEIEENNLENSERFDISAEGKGNSILLAVSALLQGYRTDSELSELVSNISTDIREDGVLDSSVLGSKLLSHAYFISSESVKKNLEARYENLGNSEAVVPDFSEILNNFKSKSLFEKNHPPIEYPENGKFGINLLDLNVSSFIKADEYSLRADLKKLGQVKIKISGYKPTSGWMYNTGGKLNISVSKFYGSRTNLPVYQFFESVTSGNDGFSDLQMSNFNPGNYTIDYYEMGSDVPTRTREVSIDYDLENDYIYVPDDLFERRLEFIEVDGDYYDDYVKKDVLLELTELDIQYTFNTSEDWQIKDFTGIESIINLKKLNLRDNDSVTQIDLSSLTGLTDLDATECDNLTCIIVSQEQLDNIPSGWKKADTAEYKLTCDSSSSTIWNGSNITFTKADGANPEEEANQDRITDNIWITRGNDGGQIFNIKTETSYNKTDSPVGTKWAVGTLDEIETLTFKKFRAAVEKPNSSLVGKNLVMYLEEDDIYLSVKFTSWSDQKNGGFAYERSTKP
ncbi:hypothetical protein N9523_07120 [Flavobacteriaceae bacterium]|nr:hypothetical protein [Flavobacteriaceae bacterium]